MLNSKTYLILKIFQTHKFASANDIKVIFKNNISILEITPYIFDFYKKGYIVPINSLEKIDDGVPLNLKFKLSILGEDTLINYEEEQKKLISSRNFSKLSLLLSFISLIISGIALFKS